SSPTATHGGSHRQCRGKRAKRVHPGFGSASERLLCPMTRLFALALLFIGLVWPPAGRAEETGIAGLYRTRTIVTGMREETRLKGFEDCLRSALLKVSGDQRVLDAPRLASILAEAAGYATAYRYH